MQYVPLASCQIIPQQVVVVIGGDVHFDGLVLAVVVAIVLWILIRRKP